MWAQVLRVILTHPIPFIASSAVLVTLRDKVDLARITTPPAQPVSPSPIVSSPSLSSGLPFAEPEDFRSNALPQDFGCLEWFDSDLAAPTPGQSDFKDYQQEQDPSSEVSYSWPEDLPVEDEPSNEDSNEDSNALQDQDQSEFNGEFEDFTITLPPIVPPSTTSGVARTGYFSLISYVDEYFFGDGRLDQSKLNSESDAVSSNEDPSQCPVAPVSGDFYGGTPSPIHPWMAVFFHLGLALGCLIVGFLKVKNGRKLPADVEVALVKSRMDALVKSHEAADEARNEEAKRSNVKDMARDKKVEKAYQALVKADKEKETLKRRHAKDKETLKRRHLKETGKLKKRIETIEEEKETLIEENESLQEELNEISGGARSTYTQELDEGNEGMEKMKEELASLRAENKELSIRLGREYGNDTESRRLLDTAKAHAERLKRSLAKNEQEIREAHEAKFQAVTEASEARKEAEASRATAKAAQLELDSSRAAAEAAQLELDVKRAELDSVQLQLAKFKDDAEASRNETSSAIAREEAAILKIASLEKALAESEEKKESAQKEADATISRAMAREEAVTLKIASLEKALAESEEKKESAQKEADATISRAMAREEAVTLKIASLEKALAESEEKKESAQKEADATISSAMAREDAAILKIASLEKALAESEEKKKSAQKEADATISSAMAREEAATLKIASLEKALAESEEKTASAQKKADATIANPESHLNAEKLESENLAHDYERGFALKTEVKVEATPPSFDEHPSVPVQPSVEAAVPTPVTEPQSSLAEDGLVHSSDPATTSNTSGQSWLKPQGFTMEVPRATSFPKYEPGLFGISFGKESAGLAQQEIDAVASCGGTDNSKSNSMEVSDLTASTTSSGSIFGPGPATLPNYFNGPNLASSTASLEGPAAVGQQPGTSIFVTTAPLEGPATISQQPGAQIIQPDYLECLAVAEQLVAFLQNGGTLPPALDPSLAGAASFVDQDPNAVASQDMSALSSYGGGDNSGLNSMAMEASTTSSMANTFGYNAPAANPPMAVNATFNTTTNTVLENSAPFTQRFAGGPEEEAYNSIIALADDSTRPLPSQDSTSTGASSMVNQQWGALQPTPNPGPGMSLGQEQSFDPNAVSQTPMYQNAQAAFWNGQPPPQQNQNQGLQQGFGAYANVPPNPNHFLGSSQTVDFQFTPQTVSQLGNIGVQPNPLSMHPTSGPLIESGPATISPHVFFNPARDSRYLTNNSPFAMGPVPYYAQAPLTTSYNPSAAPPFAPPVNQIPETTPIDPSRAGNWSAKYSAPVVENNYTQPSYNGPAGDDEVSLGENDGDEDWRQCHASLSGFRESAPSPDFESRGPAGQDPQEGDWGKFEDDLDRYSDPGTGDIIVPISPPLNLVSEGDLPPAAATSRPIKRLPRSLRRAQVNEAGQFPIGTPVAAAEAVADEGDSSGAWGATDDDQQPPTPPKTASGERAIRALPKSRRRQATSQMSVGN